MKSQKPTRRRPSAAASGSALCHASYRYTLSETTPYCCQWESIRVAASCVNKSVQLMIDTTSKFETKRYAFSVIDRAGLKNGSSSPEPLEMNAKSVRLLISSTK